MIDKFLTQILSGSAITEEHCKGYDRIELIKISRLYDITIKGQLLSFLAQMGKCDGGLFGDSVIQLYRSTWRVREHLLFQADFFDQMQEAGHFDFLNQPFVFSFISESQYYFVQTSEDNTVYHFDSNTMILKNTSYDILKFLEVISNDEALVPGRVSEGNLLEI